MTDSDFIQRYFKYSRQYIFEESKCCSFKKINIFLTDDVADYYEFWQLMYLDAAGNDI
jgi:hypothetical protein